MTQNDKICVKVENFNFWYTDNHVVKDVTFNIQSREVTSIIGPSGCGKSTFLRCLNRMNDLIPGTRSRGLLEIEGQDINAPQVDVVDLRKKVGMVFQRPNPFPKSIFDNVAYGMRVNGIRNKEYLTEAGSSSGCVWHARWRSLRRSF